ncbi:peptidase inhibitor family I36 protein [Actinomadura sp. NAK00032]|uniref:peptidase inhibitor family I36 protein n=1 Tax=Actinomadura sp. NAK00032 TaxID=2742128 RepID=UPI0015919DEF|nr:peptidase inhibitor family I36 protein [Actinomadura sp. NAK00032]QKW36269.1 peptidase inhibitor family I36 protein [Actinomadura sp. NAK00032]
MRTDRALTVACMALGTLMAGTALASSASAAPGTSVQDQVNDQITRFGGTQTGPTEVTYGNGAAKVVFQKNVAGTPNCPSGWYCFYQQKNWEDRRLQFQDCGGTQSLEDYGFKNQATSWHNNSTNKVTVYDRDTDPWTTLWGMTASSSSSFVGASADNRADLFYTECG